MKENNEGKPCTLCGENWIPTKQGMRGLCPTCRLTYVWCTGHKQYELHELFPPSAVARGGGNCRLLAKQYELTKRYGVSQEEYDVLLAKQEGLCAICRQEAHLYSKLSVDHDHETGAVRGLLCHTCNTGIGYLRDSSLIAKNSMIYLEGFGK